MKSLLTYTPNDVLVFSLIFIRMSGLCMVSPLYGGEQVPKRVRIFFALSLAFILHPVLSHVPIQMPATILEYALLIFRELSLGLLIGFLALAMFFGFQIGGRIISIQMGMQMANMIDPFTDISVSTLGTFIGLIIMVVFLVSNGHHYVLKALIDSYYAVPLTHIRFRPEILQQSINMFNVVIVTAFKIAAPNMVAFFAISLVFAFITRLVPQMNVFILSLPVKIGVGVLILVVAIPIIVALFYSVMENVISDIYSIVAAFN